MRATKGKTISLKQKDVKLIYNKNVYIIFISHIMNNFAAPNTGQHNGIFEQKFKDISCAILNIIGIKIIFNAKSDHIDNKRIDFV